MADTLTTMGDCNPFVLIFIQKHREGGNTTAHFEIPPRGLVRNDGGWGRRGYTGNSEDCRHGGRRYTTNQRLPPPHEARDTETVPEGMALHGQDTNRRPGGRRYTCIKRKERKGAGTEAGATRDDIVKAK